MYHQKLLLSLVAFLIIAPGSSQKYNVCSTAKNFEACQQIDRSNDVKCLQHANTVGCIHSIEDGRASFAKLTAEEALLATNLTKNLAVVGELIAETNQRDVADYETVVIVRGNLTNGIKGLKGSRYCHPGFEIPNVTPYVLKEFEKTVLNFNQADTCSPDVTTITEKHLKALAEFFGPSCRPGQWAEDLESDKKLKLKYNTLTQLCNVTSYLTNSVRPFEQSLDCLTSGYGDVAFTTISAVKKFAENSPDAASSYRYLCREDFTSVIDQSCSWTKQPWSLLVANKDVAANLTQDLRLWFSGQLVEAPSIVPRIEKAYVPHLKSLLEFSDTQRLNVTSGQLLKDYVAGFRAVPNLDKSKQCKTEIKWCVVSEEERQKCKWLSQASLNYGLQPVITCVRRPDKSDCLEAIRNTGADIVTIDADDGYSAVTKNLSAIGFPETAESEHLRTLLIVKPEIENLESLKGTSGCFPVYGGIAWVSFIDHLHRGTCDFYAVIRDFVGDSCIPGTIAIDTDTSALNVDKLCHCTGHPIEAQSSDYCNADSKNMYYQNNGSINCFESGATFAVITTTYDTLPTKNYTVLCKNGTRTTMSNVDKNCFLSTLTSSAIVTRRVDSTNEDVKLVLLEFDKHFARDLKTPFKLFDDFNGTKDLLFKDSTAGLDVPGSNNEAIRNYVELFSRVQNCKANDDLHLQDGGGGRSRLFGGLSVIVLVCYQIVVRVIV